MKRTNSQSIGKLLEDFFQENPLLADKLAETRLIDAWKKVLGSLTSQYTTNIYIKKKVLYVKLSSSVLRNELSMCREQLVKNLNKEAGREVINDIILS